MQTTFLAQLRNVSGVSLVALVMLATLPAEAATKTKAVNDFRHDRVSQKSMGDIEDDGSDASTAGENLLSSPMSSQLSGTDNTTAGDTLGNFGPSSGTMVGNRALELRDEVLRLRASVNLNTNEFNLLRASGAAGAVQYHSTVAAITARLQNGTTRGNPILLRQWDEAEASLNEVTTSLNRLNALQSTISADASLAGYLLESVQAAFQLSGAVDEDHDQLKLLRDETSRMIVQLDYLGNQIADDIQRQTLYATTERSNIQTLAFAISRGELLGNNSHRPVVVNQSPVTMMPASTRPQNNAPMSSYAPTPASAPVGQVSTSEQELAPAASSQDVGVAPSIGRLLVLIRYNKPVVEYEQQLSQAVSAALERRPNSDFSVVAVSPSSGDSNDLARAQEASSRNAETVKRSLVQLGLPSSRITVSSTQTQTAQTPEVHVYVK